MCVYAYKPANATPRNFQRLSRRRIQARRKTRIFTIELRERLSFSDVPSPKELAT